MTDITGDVRLAHKAAATSPVATIRALNDAFRKQGAGGIAAVTPGIKALGMNALVEIVRTIRDTDDFSVDNDPYGEHDMGAFMHNGDRIFWKIDYYDFDLQNGSPDPANLEVTTRVLTIMLASEY
jgi:hypothetical protein